MHCKTRSSSSTPKYQPPWRARISPAGWCKRRWRTHARSSSRWSHSAHLSPPTGVRRTRRARSRRGNSKLIAGEVVNGGGQKGRRRYDISSHH